ncbi:response regulator [Phenylobacterium sp.]|uniref:response regulator n=1 Tax=Phenylobacterium sp. TaxID=1871053 RepID=UPI00271F1FC7|nr:response regulator [Phenylobacterium sp.]MDO8377358.1 response regulator [Phenylobacterium sp.]
MFNEEHKLVQRMVPMLQRVLIVDPAPASARLLADLVRNISAGQIWNAPNNKRGLQAAEQVNPQLIFVELSGDNVDGIDFTRRIRREDFSCRQAPIIMVTATATAGAILGARDAGVHEFLRKPYTAKDLLRRLEAVTLRPRDWVEAVDYIGPDRRRFNSGDYKGKLKRRSDIKTTPDAARILQALKILRSALTAIESDPRQALRSMEAQVAELQRSAVAVSDLKLAACVGAFQRYLRVATNRGVLIPHEVSAQAAPLLAFLPAEDETRKAPPRDAVAI